MMLAKKDWDWSVMHLSEYVVGVVANTWGGGRTVPAK